MVATELTVAFQLTLRDFFACFVVFYFDLVFKLLYLDVNMCIVYRLVRVIRLAEADQNCFFKFSVEMIILANISFVC